MIAYVPARGGSRRIPRKSVVDVGGLPMIVRVLANLTRISHLRGIGISTDDEQIASIVEAHHDCYGPVEYTFLDPRDAELASDTASFMDLVDHDVDRYVQYYNDTDILFVLPTAVMVESKYYQYGIETYSLERAGLIISVVRNEQSPFLSFVIDPSGGLVPLYPDCFVKPTADLPIAFSDCGCFYIFNIDEMRGRSKFLDLQPIRAVELPTNVGVDVDTPDDLEKIRVNIQALTKG
jgi:CMP-N-acetylneuraminic acid synthetase